MEDFKYIINSKGLDNIYKQRNNISPVKEFNQIMQKVVVLFRLKV